MANFSRYDYAIAENSCNLFLYLHKDCVSIFYSAWKN